MYWGFVLKYSMSSWIRQLYSWIRQLYSGTRSTTIQLFSTQSNSLLSSNYYWGERFLFTLHLLSQMLYLLSLCFWISAVDDMTDSPSYIWTCVWRHRLHSLELISTLQFSEAKTQVFSQVHEFWSVHHAYYLAWNITANIIVVGFVLKCGIEIGVP